MKVVKIASITLFGFVGFVAVVTLIGSFIPNPPAPAQSTGNAPVAAATPVSSAPAAPVTPAIPIPPMEAKIINIVNDYATKYNAAPNQMAQGELLHERAHAICHVLAGLDDSSNPFQLNNWVGTVQTLSSNSEGKGVLAVSISSIATFTTWNNDLSDMNDDTLIPVGSTLLSKASALTVGEQVFFSGRVFVSHTNCLEEQSLTTDGTMTTPDFTLRFSDIRPAT